MQARYFQQSTSLLFSNQKSVIGEIRNVTMMNERLTV